MPGMRKRFRFIHPLVCCVSLVVVLPPATAQVSASPPDLQSCRQFTRQFYDWYVPYTQKRLSGPASDVAIKRKPGVFSPSLLAALKADSEAQARSKEEIVGIDFDPFVGGQDPYAHYTIRKVTFKAGKCFAEVWHAADRNTANKPDAIAELTQQEGLWQFVNFHYPDVNADLASVLSTLKKQRGKR
jgi:hypothetical protein